ncbi:hypothetical protein JW711_06635 [Candidatus Woesearchaeota archaeon]|nr:hypothetical protein [Candidatus Woesearchaeota archaeon]
MAWYTILATIGSYLLDLFLDWLKTIFVLPFQTTDMLWLLVPVWLVWFFAEFFQEKKGTSMGNAVSNAVVVLWGSIDCARQTTYWMAEHPGLFWETFLRFFLIGLIFSYGVIIVWLGLKGNKVIKFIGRIREVTYVFIMFVPIFYSAIPFSWGHVLGAIIFFPVFYFTIELIDRYAPNPLAVVMDLGEKDKPKDSFDDNLFDKDPFPPARPAGPVGLPPSQTFPPMRNPPTMRPPKAVPPFNQRLPK